jgi:heme-degrading monooxygenase HmoA
MLPVGGAIGMKTEAAVQDLASGEWRVRAGCEDEFVVRWTEFLEWTKANAPGFLAARLIRDTGDGAHFVSFAEWESRAARLAWRDLPEFPLKFGACRALCDEMRGADYALAAAV